jgi:VWFA-related protein
MFSRLEGLLCAALVGVFSGGALAQESQPRVSINPHSSPPAGHDSPASLRLDVNVVLIPVIVTDTYNRPVTTLPKESFRVLEDGIEQSVTSFVREEAPISLGLLFDSSGSMKDRLEASIEALKQVFQTTLPGDEFFLVQFSDQARLLGTFTTHSEEIYRRLGLVQARGWTALLDGVSLATRHMKYAHNRRRVLLVLSDGNDNNSRCSASEVRNMVIEGDVCVFAISLYHRSRLLQGLAEETGGKAVVAQSMRELPDLVYRISSEMRAQYLLGYSPTNRQDDGKLRRVKVELAQPSTGAPLHASWRRGYYAPGE